MVKGKVVNSEIRNIIRKYVKHLKSEGVDVVEAILFGSYAHGVPKPWSDIDLCVVSPQFGKDCFEESLRLFKMKYAVDWRIEPHPYSPDGLREKYDPLADQIRKHGIKVV